jgi:hypothetical protein
MKYENKTKEEIGYEELMDEENIMGDCKEHLYDYLQNGATGSRKRFLKRRTEEVLARWRSVEQNGTIFDRMNKKDVV